MKMQTLALFFLAAVSIGGVAWVFLLPYLSGEKHMDKRKASVAAKEPVAARVTRGAQKTRREQVETSLKQFDTKNGKKKVTLATRIAQAGLTWSDRTFYLISAALGIVVFAVVLTAMGMLPAVGFAFAAALGAPFWLLSYLKKRRENNFLNNFPDAVDVITRGIKAGLPLLDSLKMIAAEGQEPLKSEFRSIIETQTVGIPIGEACQKLYDRMPVPEANFFGIVIAIQQKAGGNLSEALGNLSKVLRDRKKMKAKIQAMSMEAKASAAIIGSLPLAVMFLVWITSPDYISLLWTHPTGKMMLAASAMWMFTGCMVMKKMINFDF